MARAAACHPRLRGFRRSLRGHAADGRVYPNGLADVNHFHAAGGLGYMIGELLEAGPAASRHADRRGHGLARYTKEPKLSDGALTWDDGARRNAERQGSCAPRPIRSSHRRPVELRAIWARRDEGLRRRPRAPRDRGAGRVFHDQASVKEAFRAGELTAMSSSSSASRAQGQRDAGAARADADPRRPAGPGPQGGAGHRWAHVGRLRQGAAAIHVAPRRSMAA
jgi:phosphogluconate dehydratase